MQLDKCPMCRNYVKCNKCKSEIPRNALFCPGISEILDINSVPDLLPETDDVFLDGA